MPLAPQRSNPGTRGQNVRYDLRGFQQVGPDRYTDGVYTYSGDVDNALSDNRPDTVVSGLFGADDDRSRDPQWRPGQPMPNQNAPRLIGQATQLAQRRRGVSSAPLTGSPAYRRAAGDVNPAIAGAANALIEALIGKAERSTREINTRTGAIAGSLSGYGDKASGYYNDALRGSRGVGDAVSAAIRGTGQALQGDIAGKLAGIQAPGQAVDLQAGGQVRTGDAAAAAAGGMSSAELERLKGTGDASAAMMGALPRIANLAGDQQRRGVLNQIGGELTDKLAELYGKQPGMILDAIREQEKAAADARKQAALTAYRNKQLKQGQARINESKRYHDLQADLAAGRITVSQFNAQTGRMNAQTGMARLDQKAAQDAQRNAQAWARIATGNQRAGIAAADSQLKWEKFKADPTGQSGGYTKHDVLKLKQLAGQTAKESFKGYWALVDDPDTPLTQAQLLSMMKAQDVSSPAELDGVGTAHRSYQEAMSTLLDAKVPLALAQAALNRYWTKPGQAMPWDIKADPKTGKVLGRSGRPKQSWQERNPKAAAGPSVGGPGITIPTSFRSTHPTDNLPGYPAIDIPGRPGTPVKAPEDGVVVRHGSAQGGQALYFQGRSGRMYWLGHIDGMAPVGTRVRAGQSVAVIANQNVSAPHVHVGMRL